MNYGVNSLHYLALFLPYTVDMFLPVTCTVLYYYVEPTALNSFVTQDTVIETDLPLLYTTNNNVTLIQDTKCLPFIFLFVKLSALLV